MIEPTYTNLAKTVHLINNANRPWGTLIEEIPSDIGRSYQGYKRGGILEGAEKMRKELMTAVVWMFGIPGFNKLGNMFCEKVLKIPMDIEYCNIKEGNNSIKESVEYLIKKVNPKNLDVSDLEKYGSSFEFANLGQNVKRFKNLSVDECVKKLSSEVKRAKQITSISAVVLNCLAMGIILPKINQALTRKKMEEMNKSKTGLTNVSMEEFINGTQKQSSNNIAFKGKLQDGFTQGVDWTVYKTENSNIFRLMVTDIPMIIGRMVTSRNKYEALEYLVMDGLSVFFYNFSSNLIQKKLREKTSIPNINPKAAEIIAQAPGDEIKGALENATRGKTALDLFSKDRAELIYKESTYGKFGKINKFVKQKELDSIDSEVIKTLEFFKKTASDMKLQLFDENGQVNKDTIQQIAKKTASSINKANALYLGIGLLVSIIGLAVVVPKLTFALTEKITGKNQFTGIAHYDDDKKEKNVKKS